tara:strand:- start:588 stop:1784 length:1197 start_codon:yes stop_codon:yes gene_type:complete
MPIVYIAVIAMLIQQAFSTMSGLAIPFLAPPIAAETGLRPSLVGLYTAMLYGSSMLSALGGGGFLLRYGALRVSQVCLIIVALGLLVNIPGYIGFFICGAILTGLGAGPATPASSQLLTRYSLPKHAPLTFSIKQTGVPVGGVLAGILLPLFVSNFGWQGALGCVAMMVILLALILQPLRTTFDSDRQPNRSLTFQDIGSTLKSVFQNSAVRELSIALFCFTGLQLAFVSFFVLFLTLDLGWTLTQAGFTYSIAMAGGIVGRVFWGWMGSKYIEPLLLLIILGLIMGFSSIATGLITEHWPKFAVWLLTFIFGLTGIGYQGVLLAKIALVAPAGMAGVVTGGAVCFAYAGMMTLPALFGLILEVIDTYSVAFVAMGIFPIAASILLLGTMHSSRKIRK